MPIDEQFLEGNQRRYTATFAVDGDPTDPTTVTFSRRQIGAGTDTETYLYGDDLSVVRDALGVFHIDLDFDESGKFTIGVKGTGDCKSYEETDVIVTLAKAKP